MEQQEQQPQQKKSLFVYGVAVATFIFAVLAISFGTGFFSGKRGANDLLAYEPPHYAGSTSPEARAIAERNIDTLKSALRVNSQNLAAWLDLAIQYRAVGDTEGAMQIWQYLTEIFPNDTTAFFNLASAYHFEERDYEKSEQYYRRAIKIDPTSVSGYIGLHDLYRHSYKQESTAAIDVLREALGSVSAADAIQIYSLLAQYYESRGNISLAIENYQKLLKSAQALKNVDFEKYARAQLARLK